MLSLFLLQKRVHDEFSSSEDDTDSDFEDPDEIEVPGGGRNLMTIQNLQGPSSTSSSSSSNVGAKRTPAAAASGTRLVGGTQEANLFWQIISGIRQQYIM